MSESLSKKEKFHKSTRVLSFLISSTIFVYFAIEDNNLEYFIYFTDWGLFLTSLYFILAIISYYCDIENLLCNQFLVIWAFNWLITLAFWGYLYQVEGTSEFFRASITHSVPLLLTLIEFLQFRVKVERSDYIYPLSTLTAYLFLVLVPYTLAVRPIYTGIDFQNIFSVGFCFGLFWIALVFLEIVKIGKGRVEINKI